MGVGIMFMAIGGIGILAFLTMFVCNVIQDTRPARLRKKADKKLDDRLLDPDYFLALRELDREFPGVRIEEQ